MDREMPIEMRDYLRLAMLISLLRRSGGKVVLPVDEMEAAAARHLMTIRATRTAEGERAYLLEIGYQQ